MEEGRLKLKPPPTYPIEFVKRQALQLASGEADEDVRGEGGGGSAFDHR